MKKVSLKLSSLFLFFFCIFSVSALEVKLTVYEEELGVGETSVITLNDDSSEEDNVTNAWKYTPSTNTLELYAPGLEGDTSTRISNIKVTGTSSENLTLYLTEAVSIGFVVEEGNPDTTPTISSNGPKITFSGTEDGKLDIRAEGKSALSLGEGGLFIEKVRLEIKNENSYDLDEKPALITSAEATSIEIKDHATLYLANAAGKGIVLENSTFELDRASLYVEAVGSLVEIKASEDPFTLNNVKTHDFYNYSVTNAGGYYFLTSTDDEIDLFPDEIDLSGKTLYYKGFEEAGYVKFYNEKHEEISSALEGEKVYFEIEMNEPFDYVKDSIEAYYYVPKGEYFYDSVEIELDEENSFIMPNSEIAFSVKVYAKNLPAISGLTFNQDYSYISWEEEPYITGYEVYRSTSKTSGFKKIATITGRYVDPYYYDKTAKAKTTYYYKVRAYRTVEGTTTYSGFSKVVAAKYLMNEPSISVITTDYDRLTIYISSGSNFDGYIIERSTNNKTWTKVKTLSVNGNDFAEYVDKGLTLGKKYYYRVKGYAKVNGTTYYSKYSKSISEKVTLSTPDIEIPAVTFNSVTLKWSKVNKATKYQITLYEVGEEAVETKVATYETTKLTYKINDLTEYKDYEVEVKAIYGKYSSNNAFGFQSVPMPDTTYKVEGTTVTITWPVIDEATRYSLMAAYGNDVLYYSEEVEYVDEDFTNADAEDGVLTYTINNVPMGSAFAYAVMADYENEELEYSSNFYLKDYKTPVTATTLNVEKVNYKTVKATWDEVENVTGYILYRSTDNKTWTKIYSGKELSYTDTVTTGTRYYYMVRTYNKPYGKVIYSSNSASKSITVNVDKTTLSVTKTTYDANVLSWGKVSGANGYIIQRSTDNKTWKTLKTITDAKTTTYTNKGLATGTTYYYRVAAYRTVSKKNKLGAYSSAVSGTPYLNTTTVTGSSEYYAGAKITYTKVAGATGYVIYRSEDGETFTKLATTTKTYYVDTKATAGTEYSYKVRAYRTVSKKNKYSEYSNVVTATKVDSSITLSTKVDSSSSVTLYVTPVSGATKYYIYRATSKSGEYKLITSTSNLEYTDTKLKANTTYYYKVRAYNKDFGDYSIIVSAKTSK